MDKVYQKMKSIILIIILILPVCLFAGDDETLTGDKRTISGYIREAETGEDLIGASVYIGSLKIGTITNVYGYYSFTVPKGTYELVFSYIGFENFYKTVELKENIKLDVALKPVVQKISEVEISARQKNENIKSVEMSTVTIPIKTIQKIPALMGEVDVIKSIQLLPGVQTSGEGSTGFYVRGGGVDQNLILLDDATVYNASHLGGFFSVFNQDAIKNVQLYKGGIPAQYGGRLSSLVDIRMNEGNMKKLSATGGIGALSSRLTLEGPLVKDEASFIVSGRRTYIDLFFPLMADTNMQKSRMFFYDLNTKINYTLNDKNRVFLSGYFGRDVAQMGEEMMMSFGNSTGTIRWNHLFNERLFSNITLIYSDYIYELGTPEGAEAFKWESHIIDYSAKADLSYFLSPMNTIKFGFGSTYHTFDPGYAHGIGDESAFAELHLPESHALEHAAFISNEQNINGNLSASYGLRFSAFQSLGKTEIYSFDKSDPDEYKVTDTLFYSKNELYNTYGGIEPRLGLRYQLSENTSLKASYNRTFQYIHLASNSTSATPLDIWFPSSPNIKPQKADQIALGYFMNLKDNMWESSVELYYKKMYNSIDYRDHASLLLNPYIEGEMRTGNTTAYGAEFFLKKQQGKITGWISYTLSSAIRDFKDINNGNQYHAPYDKPHNISVVLSYDLSKRICISSNWVYSSGNPATMPTGRFEYQGMIVPVYSDRNAVRLPDYHRLDLSLTYYVRKWDDEKINKKGKTCKKYESSWNISAYNAYNRHNAYSINFRQDVDNPNVTYAEKMYLFKIVPSITYNFKF